MNSTIEVTGWDAEKGAATRVSTYNQGRRNRRNRWTVHERGDHAGAQVHTPEHQVVRDPMDGRKYVGVAFNRGHRYEVDAVVDGEFEHTLLVDATDDYQVISYYDHPALRVKDVRVLEEGDSVPPAAEDSIGDDEDGPLGDREVGADEEE